MSSAARTRGSAGYALLAVLLFLGIIGTFSAIYLRHVMLEDRNSPASPAAQHGALAVDAALAWGAQVLCAGVALDSASIGDGQMSATVALTDVGDGRTRLAASALDSDGLGETVVVEAAHLGVAYATTPDELPHLDPGDASALVSDIAVLKTWYSGTQTVHDVTLTGLVIIRSGARITFDNVSITGCLLSENSLSGSDLGAYSAGSAPNVIVDGGLRIESSSVLPGVAVLLPDGVLTSTAGPCGIQIRGDVVAYEVALTGRGGINGNIATVQPLSLGGSLERPGNGRGPRAWSTMLDTGTARTLRFVAVVPCADDVADLPDITEFEFP